MTKIEYDAIPDNLKPLANEIIKFSEWARSITAQMNGVQSEVTALKVAVTEATAFDQKDGIESGVESEAAGC